MDQIRAFVGHSFSDADKPVVSAFLEFFNQLNDLLPHFSWEHAQAAEPKDLADKILAIIADKNTFIGICTKNEVVAPESAFVRSFFGRSTRNVSIASLKPKTSDWIIQEIGLAKGRGMEIVLLVEDGVREPGGLLGNIEHIPFARNNPQKAFGRIVEMVHALSPKPSVSPSASDPPSATDEGTAPLLDYSELTPKPEWTHQEYSEAAFKALFLKQEAALASLNGAFLGSAHNTGAEAVAEWESEIESWKAVLGKPGSLDKLKKLSLAYPLNDQLLANLARAISAYGDHAESAVVYLKASVCAAGRAAIKWRAQAAVELASGRDFVKADALLDELRIADGMAPGVLRAIQDIAVLRKDEDTQIAVLERKVELAPDDFDSRFSLAYKHSQIGNDDLALYHYLQVPYDSRSAVTWNNLGVQFEHFKMPNRAVQAYQAGEKKGETLAMSNLAVKLMAAGFLTEAKEIFDRARKIEGYHKNVDTGLAQLKEVPENEEKILEEALEKAHRKTGFYKALSDAVTKPTCVAIETNWHGKEAALTCTITGNILRAIGSYDFKGSALNALFGGFQQVTKYEIEYDCRLVGRALHGTVKRKRAGEAAGGLLTPEGKTKVLMYFSEDCRAIEVMENPHSTSPTFHSLRAI